MTFQQFRTNIIFCLNMMGLLFGQTSSDNIIQFRLLVN